jgi:hypothetical protein
MASPFPPAAPAPMPLSTFPGGHEMFLGDGFGARFDGYRFTLMTPTGHCFDVSMAAISTLQIFLAQCLPGGAPGPEVDVWHEKSKKHYRAVLVRELTIDEVYEGLK